MVLLKGLGGVEHRLFKRDRFLAVVGEQICFSKFKTVRGSFFLDKRSNLLSVFALPHGCPHPIPVVQGLLGNAHTHETGLPVSAISLIRVAPLGVTRRGRRCSWRIALRQS